MIDKIEIKVDRERMQEFCTVDDYIALEEGKIKGIRNVVAYFVIGPNGQYLSHDQALKLLGSLNLGQLYKLGNDFIAATEVAADADPKELKESSGPISPT